MYHWHLPSLNIPMSCNNSHADGVLITMAWFMWYTRNACRRHAFHLLFNNPLWAELFGRHKNMIFTNLYPWRIHMSLRQWLLMTETYFIWDSMDTTRVLCLHLSSAIGWQFCSGQKKWVIFWRRLSCYILYFGSFVNGVCSVSFKLQSINEG